MTSDQMIVVDASVLANALADDSDDGQLARRELRAAGQITAPDLVDVEAASALRKRWLRHTLTEQRFARATGEELLFEGAGFTRTDIVRA